jgi:hypothetical protein
MVALTNGSSHTNGTSINGVNGVSHNGVNGASHNGVNGVFHNGVNDGVNGLSHKAEEASWGFATRAVHVGSEPSAETGAVIPPISLSTTFKQNGVGNHKVNNQHRFTRDFVLTERRALNTRARRTRHGLR